MLSAGSEGSREDAFISSQAFPEISAWRCLCTSKGIHSNLQKLHPVLYNKEWEKCALTGAAIPH